MPDQHDLAVAFADVIADPGDINLAAWDCWTVRDGPTLHHYARGPCPACDATSPGHIDTSPKPIESQGLWRQWSPESPPPAEEVEIPVRCACGASHGQPGATSCGRRWSLRYVPTA